MTNKITLLLGRLFDGGGPPLDNDELKFLIDNTRETMESLQARGPYWGLATQAMRAELDSLMKIARARGINP